MPYKPDAAEAPLALAGDGTVPSVHAPEERVSTTFTTWVPEALLEYENPTAVHEPAVAQLTS
jgi:hypothetical protein